MERSSLRGGKGVSYCSQSLETHLTDPIFEMLIDTLPPSPRVSFSLLTLSSVSFLAKMPVLTASGQGKGGTLRKTEPFLTFAFQKPRIFREKEGVKTNKQIITHHTRQQSPLLRQKLMTELCIPYLQARTKSAFADSPSCPGTT